MLGWLVLAAVAAAARPKQTTKPDTLFKGPGVTILDRQGVQAIRSNKESWIVAFYAPWCDLGVPSCGGAFTSSIRLVSIARCREWLLFRFRVNSDFDGNAPRRLLL